MSCKTSRNGLIVRTNCLAVDLDKAKSVEEAYKLIKQPWVSDAAKKHCVKLKRFVKYVDIL